jgi:DNA-binding PadR family transcriptional regulator
MSITFKARGKAAMGRERRKDPMIELFILGELMDGPHHGYLLRDILMRLLGPFRSISWGTLYPLMGQLEQMKYIELIDNDGADPSNNYPAGRQKRVFSITNSGRERFIAMMLAGQAYTADFPELLTVKLLYLGWLTLPQQLAVLEHGRDYFAQVLDACSEVFTARSPSAHLPAKAREAIYRAINYRMAGNQADLSWIESEIARRRRELSMKPSPDGNQPI